jgi:CelD/BcsL family acetyltransferase involved in cellulose biosynthesis
MTASLDVVRSLDALRPLREAWDALAATSRSPLLEYDWFMSCAETFHREQDLRVVVARANGSLSAIAPLACEFEGFGRRLVLLGATVLHEPGGWLFSSDEALASLIGRVAELNHPLLLQRIAAASPLCRMLPDLSKPRAITFVRETTPSLAVPTSGAWDDYYRQLSSRIRSNLPRLRRRVAREVGPLDVSERYPTPAEVDAVLNAFAAIERSGWKGRKGSSLAQRPDLSGFFRRYCRRAAERGRLRVMTLSFGANTAAMELSIEAYNRIWQLKIGFSDAFARYYPGLQLTEASIHAAFSRHLDAYEFLGVAEPWEERWRPDERGCRLVVSYPLTARGMAYACRDFAGAVVRRARSQAASLAMTSELWA